MECVRPYGAYRRQSAILGRNISPVWRTEVGVREREGEGRSGAMEERRGGEKYGRW